MKNKVTIEATDHISNCIFREMFDIGFPKGEHTHELLVNGEIVGYVITENFGNHIILSTTIGGKSIHVEKFLMDYDFWKKLECERLMIWFSKTLARFLLKNFEVESVNINCC